MNMKSLEASRHYWQQHVAAWRCSGLKQIDYCRQHGLVPKQLRYRIAKDRRNDVCVSGTDAVTLVPVQIEEVNGAGLVLQNAGGWQLTLPSGVSASWLATLLRGLS
ncbi:MAG: IS66 family insertion sequence element accessory protein TnpB [Gammaproteobacteria bacterium]